jgi:selenide, water dikinase
VYRLDRDRALVQTVDFFTPIVDDPFTYGQIAAANSLSDVYAMGGRPLTALNLLGLPDVGLPAKAAGAILRGGAAKVREADCVLLGGHTMRNPEPFYGLAVTGLIHPRRILTNAAARARDWLVLTKPLGIGIMATGVKRGLTSPALLRKAVVSMTRLNDAGAPLAERGWVRAGTDVTGFGFLGHLARLCRESGVGAEVSASQVPILGKEILDLIRQDCVPGGSRKNQEAADSLTDWGEATPEQKAVLTDAQTSGGLLLAVPAPRVDAVLRLLKRYHTLCAAIVGRIVKSARPRIWIRQ